MGYVVETLHREDPRKRHGMSSSFWQGGERKGKFLPLLILCNLAFAGTTVFAWAIVALFVAEPISWATWSSLGTHSRPGLFEYPFVLLWMLPIIGASIAWLSDRFKLKRLSRLSAIFPLSLIGLAIAWYNIIGEQFR